MVNSDLSIVNQYDEAYLAAYLAWDSFFPLAERDLRMYLGDQWDEAEKKELFQQGRSTFVFNKIRPSINMVTGYQRKHRHSSVVVPVEGSDQQTSDQLTKLLLYAMQFGDGYELISDCFSGALKTGWNLASAWLDYRTDPIDGDICFRREPYNAFICDPYFSKRDMSDCAYILRRKYLSIEQTNSLLPGKENELIELYNVGWERDDKFTWLPYQRLPNGQKMMAYDEFWVQGWEDEELLIDRQTGEMSPFDGDRNILFIRPELDIITRKKPYVLQHIIVNNVHLLTEKNPNGLDEYPFVPFFAIFEPESDQWMLKVQSLIRTMVDPQRESNRRRSQMSDLIESQINSGWVATENSVVNPRSLFQTSQGKVIWRTQDAAPGSLEKIPPAQIPPSFFQLQELYDKDMQEVANISAELLGQADSEQDSGLKVMLRQGAALVGLQDLFDNLRYSQECLSRKVLKLIQHWSPEKMSRILGEEVSESIKNKEVLKYDISVQEGVLTNTQQQMFFQQLITLKELGEPIPPGLLARVAPLQGKTEYMQAMDEFNKKQQEAQDQATQIQQQIHQTQSQLFQSQSIANIASAKERFTRSVANLGLEDERVAQAVENRADATLKRTQAAKQIEEMDDDRLIKLLDLFMKLEDYNQAQEAKLKSDNLMVSSQVKNIVNQQQGAGVEPGPVAGQQSQQLGV